MSDLISDSSKQKRGLGRGLGSLLGGGDTSSSTPTQDSARQPISMQTSTSQDLQKKPSVKPLGAQPVQNSQTPQMTEGKVWQVGIDKLKPGAYQPRKDFKKEPLQELAQSIKENGILQPIIVRKTKAGPFEIVAGERRWRAAQLASLHEVPVLIREFEDKEALELAIIENVQREDLNPIEEAEAYSRLATDFSLSQQQIAEKVGKERATVANAMRLLLLPSEVKKMVERGEISVGHAKVLLSVSDPKKQNELAKKVMAEKIPVRKLEKIISANLAGAKSENDDSASQGTMNQLVSALSEELQKMLGTKVSIDYTNGKGKISISFYSNEELNQIVDQLKSGKNK